jgi:hypothetical protein
VVRSPPPPPPPPPPPLLGAPLFRLPLFGEEEGELPGELKDDGSEVVGEGVRVDDEDGKTGAKEDCQLSVDGSYTAKAGSAASETP